MHNRLEARHVFAAQTRCVAYGWSCDACSRLEVVLEIKQNKMLTSLRGETMEVTVDLTSAESSVKDLVTEVLFVDM